MNLFADLDLVTLVAASGGLLAVPALVLWTARDVLSGPPRTARAPLPRGLSSTARRFPTSPARGRPRSA